MSEYSVQKFGGSSMTQPGICAEIFTASPDISRLAVVSAVGKNPDNPADNLKVTDWLIQFERAVTETDHIGANEAREAVIAKNRDAFRQLGETDLARFDDITYRLMQPARSETGYAWIGEHLSARMFARLSGAVYVPSGLRFANNALHLKKSLTQIQQSIIPVLNSGAQVVSEAFFGYDIGSGKPVTLGRGGSDTSGVIYTGALTAQGKDKWHNEVYTDKDGVLSADPDIVADAHVISAMTHDEMREKMHGVTARNGVVHGDAVAKAAQLGVEMAVKNTFNLAAAGTRILSSRESDPSRPIIGISGKNNITAINVYDLGMADASNYLASILVKIGQGQGLSISNIPTGEDRIKIIFNSGASAEELQDVMDFIGNTAISGNRAEIELVRDQGAVYLVGQELAKPRTYTDTIGRVAMLLSADGESIREVISHEKSPSLALTVDGSSVRQIIQILHSKLIGKSDS